HGGGPLSLCGAVINRADKAAEVRRFYRDFLVNGPGELGTVVTLRRAAALPAIPERLHGVPIVQIAACYVGRPADGERVLRPLREFGPPELDLFTVTPYTSFHGMV